ncbi:preprotein translocase subunit SecE [Chitinispirillales bacterium ANBcel5]|uniref:preprotein translocase subunit SecE n=1 Tax=Cellulosispirillum alkaliphilum TaxID=3039283 RepID=UPI002A587013|nr:preprotein translocase subunit SecE [Chitinispirillales bacterium ANBcel5]
MQKLIQYLKDVRTELAKVSWPSRSEVSGATLLVVVLSIVVSLYIFACDSLINPIIGVILRFNQ